MPPKVTHYPNRSPLPSGNNAVDHEDAISQIPALQLLRNLGCLRDLFLRIPTHPNKEIHPLLPDHRKRDILPNLDAPSRQ